MNVAKATVTFLSVASSFGSSDARTDVRISATVAENMRTSRSETTSRSFSECVV
jgi:hypothetical protein